ncbi:MAG: glutamate racemase, partial [Chloroflexi bacterium]|nr:glutamate racemase [Chloroflexota bacterium]
MIGIFDSGVGGLSVLKEIHRLMPQAVLFYIADQAHVPYGKRSLEEIRGFSFVITRFLIEQGAAIIVVACNTASAAALQELRAAFPETLFVGMEPAVKPATQHTHNGIVGVLATPATFQGRLYNTLVERFAQDVRILTDTLPGLVEEIEAGRLDSPETRRILETAIRPMVAEGADTLVLGCTHFPFVLPLIREIAGSSVEVIDPAPAIARRTEYLAREYSIPLEGGSQAALTFATSGDASRFSQ